MCTAWRLVVDMREHAMSAAWQPRECHIAVDIVVCVPCQKQCVLSVSARPEDF